MKTAFHSLSGAIRRRAAYRRTVAEIRAMPRDTAIDLGIYRPDAKRLARRAVYGE